MLKADSDNKVASLKKKVHAKGVVVKHRKSLENSSDPLLRHEAATTLKAQPIHSTVLQLQPPV